jgi:8-amino-7-oxononanoate synthase
MTIAEANNNDAKSASEIEAFIANWTARKLKMPVDSIARDRPLIEYGMDSLMAVNLSGRLEDLLGRRISGSVVWEYPTLAGLADYLASGGSGSEIDTSNDNDAW